MLAVEMLTLLQCNEELRGVRVWTTISHGQNASMSVPALEVFIFKGLAFRVDAVATSTITLSDITSLDDEAIDYSVDAASKVVQLSLVFLVSCIRQLISV